MKVNAYKIWTRGFTSLCVLIVLLGMLTTYFGLSGIVRSKYYGVAFFSGSRAFLVLCCVLLSACLIGFWFAKGRLLRAGLLFQAGSRMFSILSLLVVLQIVKGIHLPFFEVGSFSFLILQETLGMLSLACLSYGIARWQPFDRIFLGIQAIFALGMTGVILWKGGILSSGSGGVFLQIALIQFLMLAGLVSLLLRPACWKAHPLITLCFTLGGAISQLVGNVSVFLLPDVLAYQLSFGAVLLGDTLFLLGLLLFIQIERVNWRRMKVWRLDSWKK